MAPIGQRGGLPVLAKPPARGEPGDIRGSLARIHSLITQNACASTDDRPTAEPSDMSTISPTTAEGTPSFGEHFRVWFKIGCISFGGPAGQIAMMHRILVDEKKWIDEPRFLHALNFCMLLPGPEATKLATYIGWLLHGTSGGLIAGILFVLPGALVMLGLSLLYTLGRGLSLVDGALYGIKAAVLVIVVEALIRIARRGLKTATLIGLSLAAFIGIFFFALPFPVIVIGAALIGYAVAQRAPERLG